MLPSDTVTPWIGMGCMRLSTDPAREDERSIAVLHAALDAGVTLLDTADAYCLDDSETGHNERLIARALAGWNGARSRVTVATKGGLVRPGGLWRANGRAVHLARACGASRRALGVERITLYQLHAPDSRTPLETSVRALAALKRDGVIERVGLCNVTVGQIERAREIVDVAAVQVELSPWQDASVRSGVVAYCLANGIPLLAYRPLGGAKLKGRALREDALNEVAARQGATAHEVALAWLRSLSPLVVPIPGPTRVETARSAARAAAIALSEEDRARLDERFAWARIVREGASSRTALATEAGGVPASVAVPTRAGAEVVLIMGLPAAGKSTLSATFVSRGFERLNRDEAGGSLDALVPALDGLLARDGVKVVLDNTYTSRASRAPVLQAARRHGVVVRCVWLRTELEDAQRNAVTRMLTAYGRLLTPEEIARTSRTDPAVFGPHAQFRHQRELEPPDLAEGFAAIDVVPFVRAPQADHTGRAILVWCDGVLWRSRSGRRAPTSAEDVEIVPDRADVLRKLAVDGRRLLGISWQPEIAEGKATVASVDAACARLKELLAVDIEVEYCPHAAGPPVCWCRKPLPGLGALFIHRHRLDPASCLYVGSGSQDPGYARRLGFAYRDAMDFFGEPAS